MVTSLYTFNSKEELAEWIAREVVGTNEALELLGGSRQNLHNFVKSGKLVPVKESGRERLFFREDVLERKVQTARYNRTDKK